ncbi:hypothetical protein Tco_1229722 [Tanacetum coccineum]
MSNRYQELASPEQMASGKDFSNLLMADSLPKTICNELASPKQMALALAIPEQTANWLKNIKSPFYGVWKLIDMPYWAMWDTGYWGFLGAQIRCIFLDEYGV